MTHQDSVIVFRARSTLYHLLHHTISNKSASFQVGMIYAYLRYIERRCDAKPMVGPLHPVNTTYGRQRKVASQAILEAQWKYHGETGVVVYHFRLEVFEWARVAKKGYFHQNVCALSDVFKTNYE